MAGVPFPCSTLPPFEARGCGPGQAGRTRKEQGWRLSSTIAQPSESQGPRSGFLTLESPRAPSRYLVQANERCKIPSLGLCRRIQLPFDILSSTTSEHRDPCTDSRLLFLCLCSKSLIRFRPTSVWRCSIFCLFLTRHGLGWLGERPVRPSHSLSPLEGCFGASFPSTWSNQPSTHL